VNAFELSEIKAERRRRRRKSADKLNEITN
jgi:hypothetical protein